VTPCSGKRQAALDKVLDHQRVVVNDVITSVQALAMGDLDRLDSASQEILRRCDVIDYEPYRCWGHLLRARLHQERHDIAAAAAQNASLPSPPQGCSTLHTSGPSLSPS
jgi:predicted HicB family RNase H-like nuclease